MKSSSIILLFSIVILSSCSKKTIDIWTEQSNVSEVINYEQNLNKEYQILEKSVGLGENMYPSINEYNIEDPLIVLRPKTKFLPIYAEYFYSKQDSIIRYVSYDLEIEKYGNYNNKPQIWKEESLKLDEYNSHYEKIKKQLIKQFGNPNQEDSKPQNTKSQWSGPDYLSRNTIWDNEIMLMKLNMIFAQNTYRIRLNYYWK